MKKALLIIYLQIFCLLTVTAQVKNNIARFYAFVQETVAGNIQVDEKGEPVNTGTDHVHYLYAETTGKYLPQWNMVYTHSGIFAIQAEEIDSAKITVGKLKSSTKKATILRKRGNRLWKLTLIPVKAVTPANIKSLLKSNDVIVATQFGDKQFTHTIAKEIVLETLFYE